MCGQGSVGFALRRRDDFNEEQQSQTKTHNVMPEEPESAEAAERRRGRGAVPREGGGRRKVWRSTAAEPQHYKDLLQRRGLPVAPRKPPPKGNHRGRQSTPGPMDRGQICCYTLVLSMNIYCIQTSQHLGCFDGVRVWPCQHESQYGLGFTNNP